MELSVKIFLIVCPFVFLGGFVDAIGGGGGLISLPAYLIAGLPTHMAIATNKLSSACGTALTAIRFIKNKLINFKITIPGIIAAFIGSSIGARLSLMAEERLLGIIILPVLFIAAFIVLNKKIFGKEYDDDFTVSYKLIITVILSSLFVGMYDGFYGPGTGTFLIIAFNAFGKLSLKCSNALAKMINLTTNITSLAIFIMGGQVIWLLGLCAAVCGIMGNYLGSSLAIKKSDKYTKPIICIVLVLLFVKILVE